MRVRYVDGDFFGCFNVQIRQASRQSIMKLVCETCHAHIPSDDVNVQKDIAFCRTCNSAFPISEAVHDSAISQASLNDPPKGAWLTRTPKEAVIGATTRSKSAFFIVPFALVWAGGSLGGIYGTQIASGEFNILLCLFGVPFLIGSIFLTGMALMTMFGKVELRFDYNGDRIFTGIGMLGWTRKFDLSEVESIKEDLSAQRSNNGNQLCIVMEGKRRIRFGSMLSDDRRYFMINALRSAHSSRKHR